MIVVDDGSTDDTAAVVARFEHKVKYYRQENARQAAARNRGVSASRGEFVAFLDADDEWRGEKLTRQLELLEATRADAVSCGVEEVDEYGRHIREVPFRVGSDPLADILLGRASGLAGGSTLVVRRRTLDAVGPFDPRLPPCEDTDLFWRLSLRHRLTGVEEPLVRYRLHDGNAHRKLAIMTLAWELLYAKALSDPAVRKRGPLFRARCRGRLYYMLAGDHLREGRRKRALQYGLRAAIAWPPAGIRALSRGLSGFLGA